MAGQAVNVSTICTKFEDPTAIREKFHQVDTKNYINGGRWNRKY